MEMFWIVVAIVVVLALREFVFVPFKQNPYEYVTDENGNEYVKDNTDK
jgi:hypothetical protein